MKAEQVALSERYIAYHEAGHTAAYLVFGGSPAIATIVPNLDRGTAGQVTASLHDDSPEGRENFVITLYAGAAAARRIANDQPDVLAEIADNASDDEEAAHNCLRYCRRTEVQLRHAADEFVSEHQKLIELIAADLQRFGVLCEDEIGLIYAIYRGEATPGDMEHFRTTFADDLVEALYGRRSAALNG